MSNIVPASGGGGSDSNLIGSTWVCTTNPGRTSTYTGTFSVNFVSNGTSYTSIECSVVGGLTYRIKYDATTVYNSVTAGEKWVDEAYKTIYFTGGTDITASGLRDILDQYFTRQVMDNTGTWHFDEVITLPATAWTWTLADGEEGDCDGTIFNVLSVEVHQSITTLYLYNSEDHSIIKNLWSSDTGWWTNDSNKRKIEIIASQGADTDDLIIGLWLRSIAHQITNTSKKTLKIKQGTSGTFKVVGNVNNSPVFSLNGQEIMPGTGYSGTVTPIVYPTAHTSNVGSSTYIKFGSAPTAADDYDYYAADQAGSGVLWKKGAIIPVLHNISAFGGQEKVYAWYTGANSQAKLVIDGTSQTIDSAYTSATEISLTTSARIELGWCAANS